MGYAWTHITGYSAIAHGDEEFGVGANLFDLLLVVDRGDRSLDEGDVDLVGKLLGVDDGAVDDIDMLAMVRSRSSMSRIDM